ncbi:MAG TPA: competence/damage-inducible protein A [Actinomycetota bacterium]|nr:competence/damage-inducible protein A [Actinomycetota bacterium]
MRAEVVAVGTELLLGDIANTNAQTIGQELARIGVDCFVHTAVGDNVDRIAEALRAALERADAVVVTGGLGPTQDDVTREAIASLAGVPLIRDPQLVDDIRARFERMRRDMPVSNLRQAERPEGSVSIPNPIGTAPGLLVEHDGKAIYAVPGVPSEMERMLHAAVLPDLVRRSGEAASIVSRVVRVGGLAESAVGEALGPTWTALGPGDVTMAFLAGGGEVRVRLTAKAPSEAAANERLDQVEAEVRAALGPAVVGVGDETVELIVSRLLDERGWTLACAESITGGLIATRITELPGASTTFRGGVVSYATDAKSLALGVDPALIEQHGVVSGPVARAMAAGARKTFDADVGIATTGVAGPTELDGKPVGTVVLAVSGPLGEFDREVHLPGDRTTIRRIASGAGLNLCRLYLLEALDG